MASHFETGGLSPIDATVAIRSLPRRFAEAFARATSPQQLTPEVLGHAAWTATALESVRRALQRVVLDNDPSVELPPVDPPAPVTVEGPPAPVLTQLAAAATGLADAMADIGGQDWTRTGRTANGPVTALDIAQLAVRIGIAHLRAAEAAIAANGGEAGGSWA
jgi:hypothetical protein